MDKRSKKLTSESKAISFLIFLILFGLVLVSFSLFYKNGELICKQTEPSMPIVCELTESNVFVSSVKDFELLGARLVQVEIPRSRIVRGLPRGRTLEEKVRVYLVVLQTNIGDVSTIPLMGTSPIVNSAINLENRINTFIDAPKKNTLTYNSEPVFYATPISGIFGFVMVVLGTFLIYRIWRFRPENISSL